MCIVYIITITARARRQFGLSVVPDTSRGLHCGLCKDVCRVLRRADIVYGCKVFAKPHSQILFRVCDGGDRFCVVQKLRSTTHVFYDQGIRRQRHDCVSDSLDAFVFYLRCVLYCTKRFRAPAFKRAQGSQVRFAHREKLCAAKRRYFLVVGVFAHIARLYPMK